MSQVAVVTDDSFETEVLQSPHPVLVDFWSPTCGPCRQLAPVIEQLAQTNPGVKFAKVDVSDHRDWAAKYGVMYLPTLILFKQGDAVQTLVGLQGKPRLQSLLDEVQN